MWAKCFWPNAYWPGAYWPPMAAGVTPPPPGGTTPKYTQVGNMIDLGVRLGTSRNVIRVGRKW